MPDVTEPYIDAHCHVWTPDLGHYPLGPGFQREDMQPPSFTAEELLATCRPNGVGRVNLIQMSYYGFDNSYMLDMIKLYPDRFVGTAIIDVAGPDPAAEMKRLLPLGVRAFRLQPEQVDLPIERWLEHPGYDVMFRTAAETKQVLSFLVDPRSFPEIERMCRKHSRTSVIIDHLGRIGIDGLVRKADVDALCNLAIFGTVYVKVGAFYALGAKKAPYTDLAALIERVVEAYKPQWCLWESDCPFQVVAPHTYAESIALVRDRLAFLDAGAKKWMLGGTAEALLFWG